MGATEGANGKVITIPNVDITLSVEGAAADAKATGEAIYNKPTGNYVGTGKSGTVEMGVKSSMLQVVSDTYVVLVTSLGAMAFYKDGTVSEWVQGATFTGDLHISTDHEALNSLDVTYTYQVL